MTDSADQQLDTSVKSDSNTSKHTVLKDRIEVGLMGIQENEVIAEFSFKRVKEVKKGLKFIFAGVKESNNRKYPEIKIQILGARKSSQIWIAKWAIASDKNKNINFQFRELGGYWTCFKINEMDDEGGLRYDMQSDLPGFRPLADENFTSFWFQDDDNDTSSRAPEITRQQRNSSEKFKKYFWDKLMFTDSKFTVDPFVDDPLNANIDTAEKLAYFITGLLCWRFFMICCSGSSAEKKMEKLLCDSTGAPDSEIIESISNTLPRLREYRPKRPVDINPQKVYEEISQELKVPWHVVASATAALNAGKHIIFTGPPGCGKTHIASIMAKYVSKKPPLMATASQAWSADEIIGRYMPAPDGKSLVFKRGFFLQALQNERWLIIDEINRCDIDNCFGELFTVLSGQSVTLPFEDIPDTGSDDSDSTDSKEPLPLPVRIVVGNDESTFFEDIDCTPIRFSVKFRLLATMNDSDVAGLNQLSYALRRRFAIIRIEAPDDEVKKKIFETHIEQVQDDLDLDKLIYKLSNESTDNDLFKDHIKEIIFKLFAHDKEKHKGYEDLIDLRIVGVAPVLDIIRFVGEGMRAPSANENKIKGSIGKKGENKKQLINSFLAMGLVLNVFPQLDAAISEPKRFEEALQCIFGAFDAEQSFLHIKKIGEEEESSLKLKDEGSTIHQFLCGELKRQFAYDHAIQNLVDDGKFCSESNYTKQSP